MCHYSYNLRVELHAISIRDDNDDDDDDGDKMLVIHDEYLLGSKHAQHRIALVLYSV